MRDAGDHGRSPAGLAATGASTRPACETPEISSLKEKGRITLGASTRPACETPEIVEAVPFHQFSASGFNEAGVRDAGDHERRFRTGSTRTRFNEAGVRDAGDPLPRPPVSLHRPRFNEAGVRDAGDRWAVSC